MSKDEIPQTPDEWLEIRDKIIADLAEKAEAQAQRIKLLSPNLDPAIVKEEVAGFLRRELERAFSAEVLDQLRSALLTLVLTGKGKTRRNRAAVA